MSDSSLPWPWPVKEKKVRIWDTPPILSIVIPTFDRKEKLAVCVQSIIDQIVEDVIGKVEIIISDNDSPSDVQDFIRSLYNKHESVSYYLNAINGAGGVQILSAPSRAQGKWMWLFGDDDLLIGDGLSYLINRLEFDNPSFLTINRCIANDELNVIINPSKNTIPSLNFPTFIDLMSLMGIDQLSFFTSQIYNTKIARSIDVKNYIGKTTSAYFQIAYYLEAYANETSAYEGEVFVVHRWQPDDQNKHNTNFYHLAATLPEILSKVRDRLGLPCDLFERIGGAKNITVLEVPDLKYADNIIQYLWWCVARDVALEAADWKFLLTDSAAWSPERSQKIREIYELQGKIIETREAYEDFALKLEQAQTQSSGATGQLRMTKLTKKMSLLADRFNGYLKVAIDEGSSA